MNPHITSGIDVALLVFWAFLLFFIVLVFYLRREDRREGYPVEDAVTGRLDVPGGPLSMANPKTFRLPFGHGIVTAPTQGREPVDIAARRTERFAGAPYAPTGDPLVDGIGPAAWADRAKRPDLDMHGNPRIVPLTAATGYWIAAKDSDLTGWPVIGADGGVAGAVANLWIDTADRLVRYIEIAGGGPAIGPLLAPMMMARIDRRRRRVTIDALDADRFAGVPRPASAGTVTLYEEDRIQAWFGGGYLYGKPSRQEPFL